MAIKPLICPQCSGEVILDKDQEFGFCKYCGTKVQNENFVKVKGKIKVDNSEYVEKFLANARRALSKEDWEEVEKYYNLVEQNEPDNIEAIFYSAYGKAMLSLYDADYYKREQKFNVLINSVSILDDHFDVLNANRDIKTIENVYNDLMKMKRNTYVYSRSVNQYGIEVYSNASKTEMLFINVIIAFAESVENVIAKLDNGSTKRCSLCGASLNESDTKCPSCNNKLSPENIEEINLFCVYAILVYAINTIGSSNQVNSQVKIIYLNRLPALYTRMKELKPEFNPPTYQNNYNFVKKSSIFDNKFNLILLIIVIVFVLAVFFMYMYLIAYSI